MDVLGIPLINNPQKSIDTDIKKFIICQIETKKKPTSSEKGRKRILEAATIREDIVNKRLKTIGDEPFSYHMDNQCYKTHQKSVNKHRRASSVPRDQAERCPETSKRSRSLSTARNPAGKKVDIYTTPCVICGQVKYHGSTNKHRICESGRAQHFLEVTSFFQDEVYKRTCDIQDIYGVFGSDIYYHPACFSKYIKRFEISRRPVQSRTMSTRKQLLDSVFESIHQGLVQGKGYPLSDIRDRCNNLLSADKVDNRQLKVLLTTKYGNQIRFSRPGSNKKSAMIYLDCVPSEQMADTIREHDAINACAKILRSSLLNVDFGLQDKFCDAHDLESAWNGTEVPEDLLRFFGALFNFSHTDFNHPGSQTQSNDHDTEKISLSRRRKMVALFQTFYYVIHNGHKRTPMHIMNAQAIHETCKSSTLIQSFNHLGLCIGYDEVRRYHTDMATLTAEKNSSDTDPKSL